MSLKLIIILLFHLDFGKFLLFGDIFYVLFWLTKHDTLGFGKLSQETPSGIIGVCVVKC